MKKINKYFPLIIIFILLLIFTACDNEKNKSNNDKIQLWYGYRYIPHNEQLIEDIIDYAKTYCDANNIPLDIFKFDNETMTYKDYIFKRNLAAESGNMIILDDITDLSDLAKTHADYTKLKIYNNLLSPYKNRFCIPIGRDLRTSFFDNSILDYYQIDKTEKLVITYTDFLQIKQEMKKKGARFEPKNEDLYETVKYYLNNNGLLYINKQDDILKDNNKLKEALKKTLFDMCNDIIIYNNASLEEFHPLFRRSSKGFELFDANSKLYLNNYSRSYTSPTYINWFNHENVKDCSNKTYIIDYFGVDYFNNGHTLSLFIYKKITNEKVYDLANYVLKRSDYMYRQSSDKPLFTPILYTNKLKNKLGLNEKLEYIGLASDDERKIINYTYNMLAKDEVKSKEIADAYFSDHDILRDIESLIYDTIHEIAEKLSEDSSENNLSLENFNSENEEINKLVDKKIDEFIKQLILEIN